MAIIGPHGNQAYRPPKKKKKKVPQGQGRGGVSGASFNWTPRAPAKAAPKGPSGSGRVKSIAPFIAIAKKSQAGKPLGIKDAQYMQRLAWTTHKPETKELAKAIDTARKWIDGLKKHGGISVPNASGKKVNIGAGGLEYHAFHEKDLLKPTKAYQSVLDSFAQNGGNDILSKGTSPTAVDLATPATAPPATAPPTPKMSDLPVPPADGPVRDIALGQWQATGTIPGPQKMVDLLSAGLSMTDLDPTSTNIGVPGADAWMQFMQTAHKFPSKVPPPADDAIPVGGTAADLMFKQAEFSQAPDPDTGNHPGFWSFGTGGLWNRAKQLGGAMEAAGKTMLNPDEYLGKKPEAASPGARDLDWFMGLDESQKKAVEKALAERGFTPAKSGPLGTIGSVMPYISVVNQFVYSANIAAACFSKDPGEKGDASDVLKRTNVQGGGTELGQLAQSMNGSDDELFLTTVYNASKMARPVGVSESGFALWYAKKWGTDKLPQVEQAGAQGASKGGVFASVFDSLKAPPEVVWHYVATSTKLGDFVTKGMSYDAKGVGKAADWMWNAPETAPGIGPVIKAAKGGTSQGFALVNKAPALAISEANRLMVAYRFQRILSESPDWKPGGETKFEAHKVDGKTAITIGGVPVPDKIDNLNGWASLAETYTKGWKTSPGRQIMYEYLSESNVDPAKHEFVAFWAQMGMDTGLCFPLQAGAAAVVGGALKSAPALAALKALQVDSHAEILTAATSESRIKSLYNVPDEAASELAKITNLDEMKVKLNGPDQFGAKYFDPDMNFTARSVAQNLRVKMTGDVKLAPAYRAFMAPLPEGIFDCVTDTDQQVLGTLRYAGVDSKTAHEFADGIIKARLGAADFPEMAVRSYLTHPKTGFNALIEKHLGGVDASAKFIAENGASTKLDELNSFLRRFRGRGVGVEKTATRVGYSLRPGATMADRLEEGSLGLPTELTEPVLVKVRAARRVIDDIDKRLPGVDGRMAASLTKKRASAEASMQAAIHELNIMEPQVVGMPTAATEAQFAKTFSPDYTPTELAIFSGGKSMQQWAITQKMLHLTDINSAFKRMWLSRMGTMLTIIGSDEMLRGMLNGVNPVGGIKGLKKLPGFEGTVSADAAEAVLRSPSTSVDIFGITDIKRATNWGEIGPDAADITTRNMGVHQSLKTFNAETSMPVKDWLEANDAAYADLVAEAERAKLSIGVKPPKVGDVAPGQTAAEAPKAKAVYHETDPLGAQSILGGGGMEGVGAKDLHLASTSDLALGQGGRTGVRIEFDSSQLLPDSFPGPVRGLSEAVKASGQGETFVLGDRFAARALGRGTNAGSVLRDSVRSVTISRDVRRGRGGIGVDTLENWSLKDWDKTVNPDGSVTLTRPAVSGVGRAEVDAQIADLEREASILIEGKPEARAPVNIDQPVTDADLRGYIRAKGGISRDKTFWSQGLTVGENRRNFAYLDVKEGGMGMEDMARLISNEPNDFGIYDSGDLSGWLQKQGAEKATTTTTEANTRLAEIEAEIARLKAVSPKEATKVSIGPEILNRDSNKLYYDARSKRFVLASDPSGEVRDHILYAINAQEKLVGAGAEAASKDLLSNLHTVYFLRSKKTVHIREARAEYGRSLAPVEGASKPTYLPVSEAKSIARDLLASGVIDESWTILCEGATSAATRELKMVDIAGTGRNIVADDFASLVDNRLPAPTPKTSVPLSSLDEPKAAPAPVLSERDQIALHKAKASAAADAELGRMMREDARYIGGTGADGRKLTGLLPTRNPNAFDPLLLAEGLDNAPWIKDIGDDYTRKIHAMMSHNVTESHLRTGKIGPNDLKSPTVQNIYGPVQYSIQHNPASKFNIPLKFSDTVLGTLEHMATHLKKQEFGNFFEERMATLKGIDMPRLEKLEVSRKYAVGKTDELSYLSGRTLVEENLRNVIMFLPAYRQFMTWWAKRFVTHPFGTHQLMKGLSSLPPVRIPDSAPLVGGVQWNPQSMNFFAGISGNAGQSPWPPVAPTISVPVGLAAQLTGDPDVVAFYKKLNNGFEPGGPQIRWLDSLVYGAFGATFYDVENRLGIPDPGSKQIDTSRKKRIAAEIVAQAVMTDGKGIDAGAATAAVRKQELGKGAISWLLPGTWSAQKAKFTTTLPDGTKMNLDMGRIATAQWQYLSAITPEAKAKVIADYPEYAAVEKYYSLHGEKALDYLSKNRWVIGLVGQRNESAPTDATPITPPGDPLSPQALAISMQARYNDVDKYVLSKEYQAQKKIWDKGFAAKYKGRKGQAKDAVKDPKQAYQDWYYKPLQAKFYADHKGEMDRLLMDNNRPVGLKEQTTVLKQAHEQHLYANPFVFPDMLGKTKEQFISPGDYEGMKRLEGSGLLWGKELVQGSRRYGQYVGMRQEEIAGIQRRFLTAALAPYKSSVHPDDWALFGKGWNEKTAPALGNKLLGFLTEIERRSAILSKMTFATKEYKAEYYKLQDYIHTAKTKNKLLAPYIGASAPKLLGAGQLALDKPAFVNVKPKTMAEWEKMRITLYGTPGVVTAKTILKLKQKASPELQANWDESTKALGWDFTFRLAAQGRNQLTKTNNPYGWYKGWTIESKYGTTMQNWMKQNMHAWINPKAPISKSFYRQWGEADKAAGGNIIYDLLDTSK